MYPRVDLRASKPVGKDIVRVMDGEWVSLTQRKDYRGGARIPDRRALEGEFYSQ